MRHVPEALAAAVDSGAATLCHAWIVTLKDGARLGFTDHDRPLAVEGVTCSAESGWTAGAADAALGGAPGALAVAGVLDDDGVTAEDLLGGRWDGARVELWRVDWRAPDARVRLQRGTVARVRREGERFTAEVEGPLAALDRVVGRTFGRSCDAALGDARCGVDRAAFPGADCDKRWSTCTGVFGNGANFQGYPDIPGDDFLTAVPREGERHDGGSRRG